MKTKRDFFLENQWDRYPSFSKINSPNYYTGRIESISFSHIILESEAQFCGENFWESQKQTTFLIHNELLPKFLQPLHEILLPGDLVALEIDLDRIKTNELPRISKCLLLAPCLTARPFFDKDFHSIQVLWSKYLDLIRTFFKSENFLEVQTPFLVPCPGTEPYLDVFSTELLQGSKRKKLYLPTSPELHLKKLLCRSDYDHIFEIKPCFRNGDFSDHHTPVFYLLEWYRAYANLDQIKTDVIHLILFLQKELNPKLSPSKFSISFETCSVRELFVKHLHFSLTPNTSREDLLSKYLEFHPEHSSTSLQQESWDDLFHRLFMDQIESQLPLQQGLFVTDYPPKLAALARIDASTGWAKRFELYWQGLEICNAFDELNDPDLQRQRFYEDIEKKSRLGKETVPIDFDFLEHLKYGMPPSAGIALGLERLFMALLGIKSIHEINPFSRY